MSKFTFVLVVGASMAWLGTQAASARGTGGAHPSEPHAGGTRSGGAHASEPHSGGAKPGGAHPGGTQPAGPHPGGSQPGSPHPNAAQSGPPHGSQPHGSQPHGSTSPAAYHGTNNVPLPTDAGFGHSASGKPATGYAAAEHKQPAVSGAGGATAGYAAAERKQPPVSGAGGAAAGHAAAERKQPAVSGAGGAAAGYAAGEKKQPPVSGAAGAAAGYAAGDKNQPQVSGAAGAAAGYAAAGRNQPQVSGAAGAAAGYAAAGRNQPQVSGAAGAAAGYAAAAHRTTAVPNSVVVARGASVRSSYSGYALPPGAWTPTGWNAGQAWGATPWAAVGTSLGWGAGAQPMAYNYGTNITYQGNQVYSGNQPVATADQYYQQAAALAQSAPAPDPNAPGWLPLGVFALVQNDQAEPHYVMQMAVNQAGILGGNYSDLISGTNLPIQGSVDKETQRAAWIVGNNKSTVGETGLYNLTQNEAPALIHIGKDRTQQWLLVRLQPPQQASSGK